MEGSVATVLVQPYLLRQEKCCHAVLLVIIVEFAQLMQTNTALKQFLMMNCKKKKLYEQNCAAKYSAYASVHLESALAPSVVRSALSRGKYFPG